MDLKPEITIKEELKYKGKIIDVFAYKVKLQNGKKSSRDIVKHPGAAACVVLKEDKFVLVKQYRKAIDKFLLEIPAGKLDKKEDPEVCIKRELYEEIGYIPEKLDYITCFYSSPGFSDEKLHLYFSDKGKFEKQHLDEDEFLNIEYIEKDKVIEMIKKGEICDGKSVVGILLVNSIYKLV